MKWGLVIPLAAALLSGGGPGFGAEKISFVTDWLAEAEQGGFYEAKAQGLYAARGLDVTIRQGGASVNVPLLIASGAADMGIGSNNFIALNLLAAGAKARAVMASFQKDPQVLITHPRADIHGIADMRGKPIMISDATIETTWVWLKTKYGFEDKQIRKYTNNLAPFLVDPQAIQQGYVTSEPYLIEKALGHAPQAYLLADAGYPGYGSLVLASGKMLAARPQAVKAFVEASIEGWRNYLSGDPKPGDALIRKDNPEISQELLDQARERLKRYGIVAGGDAQTRGIGTMSDARWTAFFETMAGAGIYPKSLGYRDAYSLDFLPAPPAQSGAHP
jgi:NitT/TauT family transport system substrate-binding protein